jgi:predicted nuclease of predicted toxin-antitoxin system
MKILFDQGTPAPLRRALTEHSVSTAYEMGWGELDNGRLLSAAEATFDALVTTDRNLRHQQNLAGRKLAILVLPTTSWPIIRNRLPDVLKALEQLRPSMLIELDWS